MEPLLVPMSLPKDSDDPSAARMLGLSRASIKQLVANGRLETVKYGKRRLVVVESIHNYVQELRAKDGGEAA